MNLKLPDRLFFILAALLAIGVLFFKHPYFQAQFSASYRLQLFDQLVTKLQSNPFDPEEYWEFRERFSPGTFLRDEETTGFFSTFRIASVEEGVTPLFYYESKYLRSLDGLVDSDASTVLEDTKKEFTGAVIAESENFVLTKETENEYVFVFVVSIEEMKRVNGMFDYLPEEQELVDNKLWYNATYLKVQQ